MVWLAKGGVGAGVGVGGEGGLEEVGGGDGGAGPVIFPGHLPSLTDSLPASITLPGSPGVLVMVQEEVVNTLIKERHAFFFFLKK